MQSLYHLCVQFPLDLLNRNFLVVAGKARSCLRLVFR